MATATCKTVAGSYSAAQPYKLRSYTCTTIAGAEMAAANVAWGGSTAKRARVNWLPGAHVPVLDGSGRMSPPWYRFFQEIAENRLGGIDAPTVPEVVTTTVQTQSQVIGVQTGIQSMGQQVSAITDTVNTQTQVAQNSNLSGSSQIPRLPSYKLQQLNKLDDA
jgi:hypothetical protein